MAGQIKRMIDAIIEQRSHGNKVTALMTETKLLIRGIDPKCFHTLSPDDPEMMAKLKEVAANMGVNL